MIRSYPFCNLVFKGNNRHIYSCPKKPDLPRVNIRYLYIKHHFPKISIKEILEEKYVKQLYSLPDLRREFGIDFKSVLFLLNYFDIEKRSLKESADKIIVKKNKKTCLKKYGVSNVSKCDFVKKKVKKTFIKHYGVDNIWKSEKFKSQLDNIMLQKYGKKRITADPIKIGENRHLWWKSLNLKEKREMKNKISEGQRKWWKNATQQEKEKRIKNFFRQSNLETRIKSLLMDLNYPFKQQFFVNWKSYDFRILDTIILIEVNGDFWHANPSIYKENDIVNIPDNQMKAKDIWEKDIKKKLNAEKYGYKVIYIWESEMKELTDDKLKIMLKTRIEEIKSEVRKD